MKGCRINVAPLACKLTKLTAFTTNSEAEYPETIFKQDQSFSVQVTIEFRESGAIALMPLGMTVRVDFFAEPYGTGSEVELGNAQTKTSGQVYTYTPTLNIAQPASVRLVKEEIYQITAVLRVGEPNWPAFITGFIDGLAIQIY
ncbi:MAG: hypothetical protein WA919_18610 [Coleofasciculaceae cyanobacterium]